MASEVPRGIYHNFVRGVPYIELELPVNYNKPNSPLANQAGKRYMTNFSNMKQLSQSFAFTRTLVGVGPIDNRPFTD